MTGEELQHAERLATVQDAYLDRFKADLLRPQPFPPDKAYQIFIGPAPITANQFIARAESYGATVWGDAQEIARASYAREGVFDEERLVLGDAEHCQGCIDDNARGFVPIGTLAPIGSRECRQNCRCHFSYRRRPINTVFQATP
jgi:hypothetical protein